MRFFDEETISGEPVETRWSGDTYNISISVLRDVQSCPIQKIDGSRLQTGESIESL